MTRPDEKNGGGDLNPGVGTLVVVLFVIPVGYAVLLWLGHYLLFGPTP